MNRNIISWTVYPKEGNNEKITEIIQKLFIHFLKSFENNSDPMENGIDSILNEKDSKFFSDTLRRNPFVIIEEVSDEFKESKDFFSKPENSWDFQQQFNIFFDNFFCKFREKYPKRWEIDYFSKSLFEKVSNNNLDIKENTQTAALMWTLL